MINYLWEYLYSKFKQEPFLTAFCFCENFSFNRKSWQWYITCGNSVRRKRTRITMRSRVVLSVLFLRLDLMFVGPWIRVWKWMSCEESKKPVYICRSYGIFVAMTLFRLIYRGLFATNFQFAHTHIARTCAFCPKFKCTCTRTLWNFIFLKDSFLFFFIFNGRISTKMYD